MEPDNNTKRKLLMEDFAKQLQKLVDGDSTLSVNGQLSATSGEIKLGSHVFVYRNFPKSNDLNIQFGQDGMVRGTPAQAIFNADLVKNRWIDRHDKSQNLSNEELIQTCIARLAHLESCKF
jgi:hypothetical protein